MFTNFSKLAAVAIASTVVGLGLNSCQRENLSRNPNSEDGEGRGAITLSLSFPSTSLTKAYPTAEDSFLHETGSADEFAVNKVDLYFFKSTDDSYAKTISFTKAELVVTEVDDDVDGATGGAKMKVNSSIIKRIPQDTYKVVALVNCDLVSNPTLANLLAQTYSTDGYVTGTKSNSTVVDDTKGLQMASRDFGVNDYESTRVADMPYSTVTVDETNTIDNPAHVKLNVERLAAKIRFNAGGSSSASATDNIYSLKGASPLAGVTSAESEYASVTINGYRVLNVSKQSYTFRHVTSYTAGESGAAGTFGTTYTYGPVDPAKYVVDPKTSDKESLALAELTLTSQQGLFGQASLESVAATALSTMPTGQTKTNFYAYENIVSPARQKNGLSTGVLFKGTLTVKALRVYDSGTQTNSTKTSDADINAALAATDPVIYFNHMFYKNFAALVKDVPALAEMTVKTSEATPTNMNVDDALLTKVFGVKSANDSKVLPSTLLTRLASFGVKYFTTRDVYYFYWIRHLNNSDPTMGRMEFSIVRNNLYDLKVSNIKELGYTPIVKDPTGDNDKPTPVTPTPTSDDDDEIQDRYIDMTLLVRPWIVRSNMDIVLQ